MKNSSEICFSIEIQYKCWEHPRWGKHCVQQIHEWQIRNFWCLVLGQNKDSNSSKCLYPRTVLLCNCSWQQLNALWMPRLCFNATSLWNQSTDHCGTSCHMVLCKSDEKKGGHGKRQWFEEQPEWYKDYCRSFGRDGFSRNQQLHFTVWNRDLKIHRCRPIILNHSQIKKFYVVSLLFIRKMMKLSTKKLKNKSYSRWWIPCFGKKTRSTASRDGNPDILDIVGQIFFP